MTKPETPDTAPAPEPTAEALAHAKEARLRYVSHTDPGIRREREGDGKTFKYFAPDGKEITDEEELFRLRKLAIPPAYENVWICADPRGHLQVVGVDARGRKQYRYHHDWRATRDDAKFDRMIQFGEALPKLRKQLRKDLAKPGLPQEKVLAVVVSLLDDTLVRVGNVEYARDNKSFGLTTLRDRHVRFIKDGRAVMQFRGKGGVAHDVRINDRRLARIVRHCQQIPGQHLFQYVDDDGARHPIDSDQVNDYLQAAMGADFTAKDFRTWGATERAVVLMNAMPLPEPISEAACNRCIVDTVKEVARELRNTPAVCRKSYINPVVFEEWKNGRLHLVIKDDLTRSPRLAERATLNFLRTQARGGRRRRVKREESLEQTLRRSVEEARKTA